MSMQRSKRITLQAIYFIVVIMSICLFYFFHNAFAQDKYVKEIVIKVEHNIIALPGNQVVKVPLSAARVRSTELRELNKKYNALSIEKLFRLKEDARVIKKDDNKEEVDLGRLFTKKIKKEMESKDKQVIEAEDIFLIQFESEKEINISQLIDDYKQLPVVKYADEVIRKK